MPGSGSAVRRQGGTVPAVTDLRAGRRVDVATEPPIRIQYVIAVARALIAKGGSATLHEVYALIADNGLRRARVAPKGTSAEDHYRREVRFARQELYEGGLLVTVGDRWKVVDEDRVASLTPDVIQNMIRNNRRNRGALAKQAVAKGHPAPRPPGPSTGPSPTEWSGEVTRVGGPATTYAMRFGHTDLWKIGYASDAWSRLSAVNRHIPVEVIDGSWALVRSHRWPSQLAAYSMEQEVLEILSPERTVFERVRCSPERLDAAWDQARAAIDRQQPVAGVRVPAGPDVNTRARPKASRRATIPRV